MRVALFKSEDGNTSKLLIVIHHLVVDGVSWSILLEDLQTLYEELNGGHQPHLPAKTTSFKAWSEQLSAYAKSDALAVEAAFWIKGPKAFALPVDYKSEENTAASAATVSVALNPRETLALLMETPAAYRTQINEVLITALAETLADWTRSSSMLIDLEGHGREEILPGVDLTRTIGWFTTIFPFALEVEESHGVINSLRVVKDQLRAIPNRGIGYGLLRYLSKAEIRDALYAPPQAQVRFNYLGQTDRALLSRSIFKPAIEATGPSQSPSTNRGYLLNIIATVSGGQLRFEWTYSRNVHRRETIERLAELNLKQLRTLIANARSADARTLSPSDFPNAKLSPEDLDKVLAKLRG